MSRRLTLITLATVAAVLTIAPVAADADTRTQLNYGYGQLYWTADKLQHIDKALWLKAERAVVDDTVSDLAQLMADHAEAMEALRAGNGPIALDDQGLPDYEVGKRMSVFTSRGLDVGTPLIGATGTAFERTLLLSLSAALNQQRHLMRVLADDEPVDAYREWLTGAESELDAIYQRVVTVLETHYFAPNFRPAPD